MSEQNKDVKEVVDPALDPNISDDEGEGDDREENFANLRKKLKDEKEKNAILASENEILKKGGDRSLDLGNDDQDPNKGNKPKKDESSETIKIVFARDMKEAVRQFTKKTKVTNEEWQQIKSKVSLKGDETLSEIADKIEEAHQSLPSVIKKREEAAFNKGRQHAMTDFNDEELDFGNGGDIDLGNSGSSKGIDSRSAKFAKNMGLTNEEIKKTDLDADTKEWQQGNSPVKKAFLG